MYSYILFDLDGTLTDPGLGITNSVMYSLKKFGIEVSDRASLYRFIGPPLRESYQRFYGFSPAQAEQATAYYREYFSEKGLYENQVYPGIAQMLSSLRSAGAELILATSKPEIFATEILRHFDLEQYFSVVAGATMDASRNEKADVIAYALQTAGVRDLREAVMVGDREHDILGAKKNGLSAIGVLYGYGSAEELRRAGAIALAENSEALGRLLLQ